MEGEIVEEESGLLGNSNFKALLAYRERLAERVVDSLNKIAGEKSLFIDEGLIAPLLNHRRTFLLEGNDWRLL